MAASGGCWIREQAVFVRFRQNPGSLMSCILGDIVNLVYDKELFSDTSLKFLIVYEIPYCQYLH